jgi:superfamily II DNA or RNA helicase
MILRDYQIEAVDKIRTALQHGEPVMYQAPTGSGKTVIFCYVAKRATSKGHRVGILVHRRELIKQTCNKLTESEVEHGVVAADWPQNLGRAVQVCSVQTLARRRSLIHKLGINLWIIDEAHHTTANTYQTIFEECTQSAVLGVSATPCRMTGAGLGTFFRHLVLGPKVSWLIEHGHLSKYVAYSTPLADTSKISVRAGDFKADMLNELMNQRGITGDAVQHYQEHLNGAPTIVFCVSVAHAEAVAQQYRDAGFQAVSVDGSLDQFERDRRIAGLGDGSVQVLTSCELISEGLDIPLVVGAQLLRPTKSVSLYLQQVGRVLRPSPGKERAIILDHVGNIMRHGLPAMDRVWTLDKGVKAVEEEAEKMLVTCPACSAAVYESETCPECGYVFERPEPQRDDLIEIDGHLVEVTADVVQELWDRVKANPTMRGAHQYGRAKAMAQGMQYKPGAGFYLYKNLVRGRTIKRSA